MLQDPSSDPRPTRHFWPWVTAAAIILPLALTGFAHFMMGHNAEAKWAAVQKRLADTHHTLDYAALARPSVPDDDNFYAIPPLKNIAVEEGDNEPAGAAAERRNRLDSLKIDNTSNAFDPPPNVSGVDHGLRWDAAAWATFYRNAKTLPVPAVTTGNPGRDILQGMAAHEPLLNELKAGLGRKYSQPTPAWQDRPHPKLLVALPVAYAVAEMNAVRGLTLHARAAITAGDGVRAVDDLCIMLRLSEGIGNEPLIINSLVATTCIAMAHEPAWMLLDQRTADDAALTRLEQCLERIDTRAIITAGLRGEMAAMAQACDTLATSSLSDVWQMLNPPILSSSYSTRERIDNALSYSMILINPPAAATGNKAVLVDHMLTHFLLPLDTGGLQPLRQSSDKFKSAEDVRKYAPGLFGLMAANSLTAMHGIAARAQQVQARINQIRIACALERHFIRHQAYPDDLRALVPDFLPAIPADPIDDQPMRYQKTPARYKLWSLGFDGDDDGGVVKPGPKEPPEGPKLRAADYPGDWVWSYERLIPEPPPK